MPIYPFEAETCYELQEQCSWEYGQICCVKFDYQSLMAELPLNSESYGYCLSPETVKIITEGLQLLEERLCWRWDGQRPPSEVQWLEISSKIEQAQLEMSQPETCMPVGAIIPFAGSSAPQGWLICDGSAINRETYANLFNLIGTIYGSGDDSTTFNLPDLRGRVPVGLDSSTFSNLGQTGGEESHVLTVEEMPAHAHSETTAVAIVINGGLEAPAASAIPGLGTTGSAGEDAAHNNLQPYLTLNFIIKC